MNRAISLVVLAAISLSLAACSPTTIDWECPPLATVNQSQENEQSEPSSVRIQIDGTASMQGFTKIKGSRYVQTLDILDRAITRAFTRPTIKYYRFGTVSQELIGEKSSLKAQSPGFYDLNNPQLQNAKLNAAITPLDNDSSDELSIIVTDLYQEESSRESPVITLLKDNYIQKGNAVGILAVKSEFDGIVYDVGKENVNFPWKASSNNSAKFHPFYVIVLGTYENIARYFNQLKRDGLSYVKDEQFIIFSSRLVEQPLVLNVNTEESLPLGIERLQSINDGDLLLELSNPDSTDILKITNEHDGTGVSYTLDYSPLPYTLPLEPKEKINSSKVFNQEKNAFDESRSNLLNLSNWQLQDKKISFVTEFNLIKKPGIYQFVVDVVPGKLKEPQWWQTWSFEEEEAKLTSVRDKNRDKKGANPVG